MYACCLIYLIYTWSLRTKNISAGVRVVYGTNSCHFVTHNNCYYYCLLIFCSFCNSVISITCKSWVNSHLNGSMLLLFILVFLVVNDNLSLLFFFVPVIIVISNNSLISNISMWILSSGFQRSLWSDMF